MFVEEAEKYQVFPLDASVAAQDRVPATKHHCRPKASWFTPSR